MLAAYQDARQCLLSSMERCAVAFPGGRYVPASVVPNGGGSMWLCVAFAYPGRLAPYDHPLVSQTLAHFEACQSPAGIPINLGWQPRGLWPGAAMECPAPVYLRRGEIDKLSGLIYGGLNCASPVWTWPEERGADAGTQVTSGDLQEAWFPVNFCRLFRDCFLYEEDATLHLAAGIPRFWYDLGKPIGVTDAPTHFGPVSYQMQYDPSKLQITGEATFAEKFDGGLVDVAHPLARPTESEVGQSRVEGQGFARWFRPPLDRSPRNDEVSGDRRDVTGYSTARQIANPPKAECLAPLRQINLVAE